MAAAPESIAGADGPLNVMLGVGVALLFAGIVVRALAARTRGAAAWRRLGCPHWRTRGPRSSPTLDAVVTGADRLSARAVTASCSALPRSLRPFTGPSEPVTALPGVSDAPEPELTRLRTGTLAPLARTLDESRRLRAAEARVAAELAGLPDGFWLVERNVRVGAHRIPFLALGATGVFAICPTDGRWTLDDLVVLSELGERVRGQLPGYDGHVHGAVCLAFEDMKPRTWFGGEPRKGRGGWVLGLTSLRPWMFSFGPEHGLRNGDVRRLHEDSGPSWNRCRTACLPVVRHLG
jgi:hypothetical protein